MGRRKIVDEETLSVAFPASHTDDAATTPYAKPPERRPTPSKPNEVLAARMTVASEHHRIASADALAYAVSRALELGSPVVAADLAHEGHRRYGQLFITYLEGRRLRYAEVVGADRGAD